MGTSRGLHLRWSLSRIGRAGLIEATVAQTLSLPRRHPCRRLVGTPRRGSRRVSLDLASKSACAHGDVGNRCRKALPGFAVPRAGRFGPCLAAGVAWDEGWKENASNGSGWVYIVAHLIRDAQMEIPISQSAD